MENGVSSPFRIPFGVMPKYMESLNLKLLTPIPQSFYYLCTQRIGISTISSTFHSKIWILQKVQQLLLNTSWEAKSLLNKLKIRGNMARLEMRYRQTHPPDAPAQNNFAQVTPRKTMSLTIYCKSVQKYHTSNRASESWSATKDNIWLRPPSTTFGKSRWAMDILQSIQKT